MSESEHWKEARPLEATIDASSAHRGAGDVSGSAESTYLCRAEDLYATLNRTHPCEVVLR